MNYEQELKDLDNQLKHSYKNCHKHVDKRYKKLQQKIDVLKQIIIQAETIGPE